MCERGFAVESLLTALVGALVAAGGLSAATNERVGESADVVFERAEDEFVRKAERYRSLLSEEVSHFEVDLDAGTITFTGPGQVITAPIQVVGTYDTLDGTFLWAWDHPSVPEPLAADARLARAFGRRNELSLFTTRKVECSEDDAWLFTGVALYLSGAEGSYRAPFGTTLVFLTFGELTIAQVE